MLVYFYAKFLREKKRLTAEFETPYYLQDLEFGESGLLELKEQLSTEHLSQFGYECFGKDKNFKVLNEIELKKFTNSVQSHEKDWKSQNIRESKDKEENSQSNETYNYNNKYLSFLED
jgi:hypothetical protein